MTALSQWVGKRQIFYQRICQMFWVKVTELTATFFWVIKQFLIFINFLDLLIEGSIFRSCLMNQRLLSDINLGGAGDLRSDLRGWPRPEIEKLRFYTGATEAEVLLKV